MFLENTQIDSFGNESPTAIIAQPSTLQNKAAEQDGADRWQALDSFFAAFGYAEDSPIRIRALAPKDRKEALPPVPRRLTRKQIAADADVQRDLLKLNETHGLYFVVNEGSDKDKDIARFTAWFAEDDERTITEQHARLDAAPLRPSVRVKTKKSVHAYWLIDGDCTAGEWENTQHRLISNLDGDGSIDNPSRVMRLPFFDHLSFDAETGETSLTPVELQYFEPTKRYTLEEMRAAFPEVTRATRKQDSALYGLDAAKANDAFMSGIADPQRDRETARKALESLAAWRCDERNTWRDVGYVLYNAFDGDGEGLALYEEWSRQSAKFEEDACTKIWESAGDRGINETRITLGSLIHWAKEDSPAFVEWFESFNRQARVERAVKRAEDFGLNDIGNARRLVSRRGKTSLSNSSLKLSARSYFNCHSSCVCAMNQLAITVNAK